MIGVEHSLHQYISTGISSTVSDPQTGHTDSFVSILQFLHHTTFTSSAAVLSYLLSSYYLIIIPSFTISKSLSHKTDLYHPNRHNQIIAIKDVKYISHAEDGAGAELERGLVDHIKDAGETLVRRGGLFDFQRTKLAVALEDDIDLLGVAITVEVEIRLQPRILIAFHDLRHGEILQQCAAHGAALGDLRRRPTGQIADEASVVEIHLRRFDCTLEDVVGVGMQ